MSAIATRRYDEGGPISPSLRVPARLFPSDVGGQWGPVTGPPVGVKRRRNARRPTLSGPSPT